MLDYSQDGEQYHILTACPQGVGRFLDIGAWNAFDKSNTRALYEQGWSGVEIEPAPAPFSGLLAVYGTDPRVVLINAAVTIHPGALKMWMSADAVSTSEEIIYRKWRDTAVYAQVQMEVKAITLEEIYAAHGPFDFVSIDTEGTSVRLFIRLLELGHRPKCICLEYDEQLEEAQSFAHMVGYDCVLTNGTNIVLVRR